MFIFSSAGFLTLINTGPNFLGGQKEWYLLFSSHQMFTHATYALQTSLSINALQ